MMYYIGIMIMPELHHVSWYLFICFFYIILDEERKWKCHNALIIINKNVKLI